MPGYRAAMDEYMAAMCDLGRRVNDLFALALGVDDPTLFARAFERPVATLRPLRYEAVASDPGAGVFGCGAHSDYGEGFWECVFCLRILLLGHSSRFCPFTPLRPPKTQTKAC